MSETLAGPASYEQIIKHSRFLARAWPIDSATQADQHLADIQQQEASHHCWAWRLQDQYRFHDANEPAGTAGRPILSAIDGQSVDAVLVVVTRWFGGVKLGTGGLVRAYGGCAAECLRLAERRVIVETREIRIWLAPGAQGLVRHLVQAAGAERLDEGFGSPPEGDPQCCLWLTLSVPSDAVHSLQAQLLNATSGQLHWTPLNAQSVSPESTT